MTVGICPDAIRVLGVPRSVSRRFRNFCAARVEDGGVNPRFTQRYIYLTNFYSRQVLRNVHLYFGEKSSA